ncbi:hypothetical protein ACTHQ8_01405 [Lysinibacillus odysseyi]|uniref:hypothetical protein n=1 Tax=Lysinibacillus odysseyi TaxID=202611 RepID=UPI000A543CA8|nr:hypothetical protein [Lysinibacillus odysseyi]
MLGTDWRNNKEIGKKIKKVVACYEEEQGLQLFEDEELIVVKDYILHNVQTLLHGKIH